MSKLPKMRKLCLESKEKVSTKFSDQSKTTASGYYGDFVLGRNEQEPPVQHESDHSVEKRYSTFESTINAATEHAVTKERFEANIITQATAQVISLRREHIVQMQTWQSERAA